MAATIAFADDPAFEYEYAPFGVDSGLCVGIGRHRLASNTGRDPAAVRRVGQDRVDLDVGAPVPTNPFGTADDTGALARGYFPLINGSDTNFSHPFVLTYPNNGYPTDKPRPQIQVRNLTGFSNGRGPVIGSVNSNQLWSVSRSASCK